MPPIRRPLDTLSQLADVQSQHEAGPQRTRQSPTARHSATPALCFPLCQKQRVSGAQGCLAWWVA
jgi:hypothetical protein